VAVRGVGIEGDIGKDREIGKIFFQGAKGQWDEAFWVVGRTGLGCAKVLGKAGKEGNASDTPPSEAGCLAL
jgi:hypothetical protein